MKILLFLCISFLAFRYRQIAPEVCWNISLDIFIARSLLSSGSGRIWSASLLPTSSLYPSPIPEAVKRGPNQSPIYIYEYFQKRARSLARPEAEVYSSIRHTYRSLLIAPSSLFVTARYDENGEITNVYFRESSWSSSWSLMTLLCRARSCPSACLLQQSRMKGGMKPQG